MKFCTDVDHIKIWNLKKKISKIILTMMTSSLVCADTCHFLGCLFVISYWLFPNILSVSDPNKVTLLKFRSKIDLSTVILSSFMPKMSKIKKVNFLWILTMYINQERLKWCFWVYKHETTNYHKILGHQLIMQSMSKEKK